MVGITLSNRWSRGVSMASGLGSKKPVARKRQPQVGVRTSKAATDAGAGRRSCVLQESEGQERLPELTFWRKIRPGIHHVSGVRVSLVGLHFNLLREGILVSPLYRGGH